MTEVEWADRTVCDDEKKHDSRKLTQAEERRHLEVAGEGEDLHSRPGSTSRV